ncbi:hypothetical protein PFISCL1PPCAC_29031, partial [Pristionchus fissidentatus]
ISGLRIVDFSFLKLHVIGKPAFIRRVYARLERSTELSEEEEKDGTQNGDDETDGEEDGEEVDFTVAAECLIAAGVNYIQPIDFVVMTHGRRFDPPRLCSSHCLLHRFKSQKD